MTARGRGARLCPPDRFGFRPASGRPARCRPLAVAALSVAAVAVFAAGCGGRPGPSGVQPDPESVEPVTPVDAQQTAPQDAGYETSGGEPSGGDSRQDPGAAPGGPTGGSVDADDRPGPPATTDAGPETPAFDPDPPSRPPGLAQSEAAPASLNVDQFAVDPEERCRGRATGLPVSETDFEALTAALDETLRDVYETKGEDRMSAIYWGRTSGNADSGPGGYWAKAREWVDAADGLEHTPPLLSTSGDIRDLAWAHIGGNDNPVLEGCWPGEPDLGALEISASDVTGWPYKYLAVYENRVEELYETLAADPASLDALDPEIIVETPGGRPIPVEPAEQRFLWRDGRWKLHWAWWCAAVEQTQASRDALPFGGDSNPGVRCSVDRARTAEPEPLTGDPER